MEDYNAINSFPRPSLPDGFRTLLFSLSKEVLREQPTNLYEFCADFFGRRLLNRGDSWVTFKERYDARRKEEKERGREQPKLKTTPDPITENTTDTQPDQFTAEEEEAIVKIQAGVRGMLTRRSVMRLESDAQAERERWLHPREQLQRDLLTASSGISFAELEAQGGVWEACQRWLHPADQLERDTETDAEPVECSHLRDRGPSLEDAGAAAALLEPSSSGGSAEAVRLQYSDVQVAEDAAVPPELVSPAYSAVSMAEAPGAISPTPPARGPSVSSVQSARHSDVSLADRALPSPHTPGTRAASLEAVTSDQAPPAGHQTPPPPPTDILDRPTASSALELAGETAAEAAAERAGSPPEAVTPRHSDLDVAGDETGEPATH